jgi:secreted protein
MSAPRSAVLTVACVVSMLVVVACAYGVLSSRHAVTVADSAAGGEDGRVVVSWGRTVGDLLDDGGVQVGDCDQVTPSVDAPLAGVDVVIVVRCRSALVHDGAGGVVSVGTVRPDTLGVLRDVADARGMNMASRASRNSDDDSVLGGATAGLSRSGSGDSGAGAVVVSAPSQEGVPVNSGDTPVPVRVVADGKTVNGVAESGASARDVAASAGVTTGPLDEVTVGLGTDGGVVVRVVRVWRGEETVSTADKAVEEKRDTDSLLVGEWTLTPGTDGAHDVSMFSIKRDGERVHSVVLGENTVAARPAVREVGTKPVSPEALVAAGVDPASPVSEETDSAGVVTARYRAPLYSLTSREDVDRLLGKTSSTGDATDAQGASAGGVSPASSAPAFNPSGSKADWMRAAGISDSDFGYVDYIISHESGWNYHAVNRSSGAYGLPQSLPAGKLASAGADWRDNPVTQLRWAHNYAVGRYGSWGGAYSFWVTNHWW